MCIGVCVCASLFMWAYSCAFTSDFWDICMCVLVDVNICVGADVGGVYVFLCAWHVHVCVCECVYVQLCVHVCVCVCV